MSIGLNDFLIEAQIFLLFDKDRKNTEKNTELRRPLFKKLRTAIEAASVCVLRQKYCKNMGGYLF